MHQPAGRRMRRPGHRRTPFGAAPVAQISVTRAECRRRRHTGRPTRRVALLPAQPRTVHRGDRAQRRARAGRARATDPRRARVAVRSLERQHAQPDEVHRQAVETALVKAIRRWHRLANPAKAPRPARRASTAGLGATRAEQGAAGPGGDSSCRRRVVRQPRRAVPRRVQFEPTTRPRST